MQHPITILTPEYTKLLAAMTVRPECAKLVNEVATRLVGFKPRYEPVTAADGVPVLFIGPSFEREASSNFKLNPAQGWPLSSTSKWIPHNGPFKDWLSAAIAAYHLNGLDKIGAGKWTWELICYFGELFNGFGYRDYHHMHTPYLWGGTNIQSIGKYDADGQFNPNRMDAQLGIIPIARRMLELDPSLALNVSDVLPVEAVPYVASPPISSGFAAEEDGSAKWVQTSLSALGITVGINGNYDRQTKLAVEKFQGDYGLDVDGVVGAKTVAALRQAVAAHTSTVESPGLTTALDNFANNPPKSIMTGKT
jgi:lysozyme family protein